MQIRNPSPGSMPDYISKKESYGCDTILITCQTGDQRIA
jgi:hypothetical protein